MPSRIINDITTSIRCISDRRLQGIGTCFAIADNVFMTAKHVLPTGDNIMMSNIVDPSGPVGHRIEFIEAERVWESENYDIAIIRPRVAILAPEHIFMLPPIRRTGNQPPMNFTANSFGYHLTPEFETGSSNFDWQSFLGMVTKAYDGVPYGFGTVNEHPLFEVSSPMLHGHSGAPVFDADLNLMGMHISFAQNTSSLAGTELGVRNGVCLNLMDLQRFEPRTANFLANT